MTLRTARMIGKAYSTGEDVNIHVVYNGVEIHNGPVDTTIVDWLPTEAPGPVDDELISFYTNTQVTGPVPVTISVTKGMLFFVHFRMNYIHKGVLRVPTDPDIEMSLNDPDTFVEIVVNSPDQEFDNPNTNTVESDGILNLHKNAQPWCWRSDVGDMLGDWVYPVYPGETITFDFYVDPAKTVC